MSVEQITARIISDAEADAKQIIEGAEKRAARILETAAKEAEQGRRAVEADVAAKRVDALEKKTASARLESAKLLLREKRRVIDGIYHMALKELLSLNKEDALRLADRLLQLYAEEGDEIIFAENYAYAEEVSALPVITQKKMQVSSQRLPLSGGFTLRGMKSDKDLSYGALLAADREEYQADLSKKLFS